MTVKEQRDAKPILFNAEMVRAILSGRKTETRRVIKPQPPKETHRVDDGEDGYFYAMWGGYCPDVPMFTDGGTSMKPKHSKGDILYVGETWNTKTKGIGFNAYHEFAYKADGKAETVDTKWHPSTHMPKEAARIFLKVTGVRVEKLQSISEDSAKNEGVITNGAVKVSSYRYWFEQLWDAIIKKEELDLYGWEANPWVWVYKFEKMEG